LLARNVLLFSLLMDNVNVKDIIDYWNLFYDFYIPKATLKTIRNQAARLVSVSKNLQAWTQSNYGTVLSMVSSDTEIVA